MLSASWKSYMCRCAFALMLAAVVVLLVGQSAVAQAPQGAAAQTPAPAPATPAPAPAAKAAAPATPVAATPVSLEKPPAPKLNPRYGQLKELTPEKERDYQRKRSEVQRWLRSGVITPDKEAEFNDYYKTYALARWTWINRQQDIAKNRSELTSELTISYKANRGTNQAHDKLQTLALQYLTAYVNPDVLARPATNFTPATRFNAILMIGELNEVEPSIGNKIAKPLPAAMPILRQCARDPRQIDAVRLGALIGIRRHCRLMMEAGTEPPRDVLGDLAVWAKMKESERIRSEAGHGWMRLVAIRTFGDVKGAPKPDYVAGMLRGIVDESESPSFVRYASARSIGSINYRNAAGLDMNGMLHSLGLLCVEVCDVERQRLRDEMESEKAPPSGGYMGDEYGSGGGMDMDMEDDYGGAEMDMYGAGAMTTDTTTTATDRQIERVRRRLQEGMTAALIGMGRKTKTVRAGEETGLNMVIESTQIEEFSIPIHDFFKVIDAKDDDDLRIQAKPLDEAIVDVRQKLADALAKIGPEAPPSPEFEPIREAPRSPIGGAYGDMYGSGGDMYGEE